MHARCVPACGLVGNGELVMAELVGGLPDAAQQLVDAAVVQADAPDVAMQLPPAGAAQPAEQPVAAGAQPDEAQLFVESLGEEKT